MDNVCIICREEMVTGAKRLPCNHIFHTRCSPGGSRGSRGVPGVLGGSGGPGDTAAVWGGGHRAVPPQLPALVVPAAADVPHVPHGRAPGLAPGTAAPGATGAGTGTGTDPAGAAAPQL